MRTRVPLGDVLSTAVIAACMLGALSTCGGCSIETDSKRFEGVRYHYEEEALEGYNFYKLGVRIESIDDVPHEYNSNCRSAWLAGYVQAKDEDEGATDSSDVSVMAALQEILDKQVEIERRLDGLEWNQNRSRSTAAEDQEATQSAEAVSP